MHSMFANQLQKSKFLNKPHILQHSLYITLGLVINLAKSGFTNKGSLSAMHFEIKASLAIVLLLASAFLVQSSQSIVFALEPLVTITTENITAASEQKSVATGSPTATVGTSGSETGSGAVKPKTDRFGIKILYPTKPGGQEWYMNMANPTLDPSFNPQNPITKNNDGSWKMRSSQVRMYVFTSDHFKSKLGTEQSGQAGLASKGYMGSPQDWRDVEMTGYVKLNKFSENDNFVWYTRGGKHTESDHCQGSAYKGNLFYLGKTQFSKEQWHVSYAKSPTVAASQPLDGRWIGFKFVVYNYLQQNGKTAVKLENWMDKEANGKDWVKVYEGADAGSWGRSGSKCRVSPDQIITWGGPIATFRWDFAPDVDFKDLSVREISVDNGTVSGILHFHGSSSSSGVPRFGNFNGEIFSGTNHAKQDNAISNGNLASGINKVWDGRFNNSTGGGLLSLSKLTNEGIESSSFGQQTVILGDNVYTLWSAGDEDNTDVYLRVSYDRGVTFGKPFNLSNNPASLSYNARMAVSGNNVYVVWEDDEGNSDNSDIFFIRSSDGGKSFGDKINLSNDPSGSGDPRIVVFGNKLYIAWTGTSPDNTGISYVESSDEGLSFTQPKNLGTDSKLSFDPAFIQNGNKLYINWSKGQEEGYNDNGEGSNTFININGTESRMEDDTIVTNDTTLVQQIQPTELLDNTSLSPAITNNSWNVPLARSNSTKLESGGDLEFSPLHSVTIHNNTLGTHTLRTTQDKSYLFESTSLDRAGNKENKTELQTLQSSLHEIINLAQSRVANYDKGKLDDNNVIRKGKDPAQNYSGLKDQKLSYPTKDEADSKVIDLSKKLKNLKNSDRKKILDYDRSVSDLASGDHPHEEVVKQKQNKLVEEKGQGDRRESPKHQDFGISSQGKNNINVRSLGNNQDRLDKNNEQVQQPVPRTTMKSQLTAQEKSQNIQIIQAKIKSALNNAQELAAQSTLANIKLEKAIDGQIPVEQKNELIKEAKFASERAKNALIYYNQLKDVYLASQNSNNN